MRLYWETHKTTKTTRASLLLNQTILLQGLQPVFHFLYSLSMLVDDLALRAAAVCLH